MDWTNDQHLDSGWVVARVPAWFAIRKSETRRERLAVHRAADGAVTVVNGLGAAIDSLYYVDDSGVMRFASEIPAGAERILEVRKSDGKPPVEPQPLRVVFEQAWNSSLRELKSSPEKFLTPGCYLALVKQSPFLEDPLVAAPQEGSIGVIYGIGARSGNGR